MSRRPKFKKGGTITCPACIENDAVTLMGQPVTDRGARKTLGCEMCGGSGSVSLVESIHGWPPPDMWVSYEKKKHAPVPLEPGPGVVVWR